MNTEYTDKKKENNKFNQERLFYKIVPTRKIMENSKINPFEVYNNRHRFKICKRTAYKLFDSAFTVGKCVC